MTAGWLSNTIYRVASRVIGQALGRLDGVESVFLRRTVAMGEVSFGRSDIDLTIVLADSMVEGGEPDRLLNLARWCQRLRAAFPVLGECESGTAEELIRSYRADPFRASVDRRTAVPVFGSPLEIPRVPVAIEDALFWMVSWYAYYLPVAMQRGQRRNMRKFVLEMWNAARTATGDIAEPYRSRRETEQAWRAVAGDAFPLSAGDSVESLYRIASDVVHQTYVRLYTPLKELAGAEIHGTSDNAWVLTPAHLKALPVEVRGPATFTGPPEALDLLVQHVNPRIYGHLPEAALGLGVREPGYAEWLSWCRRLACDPRLLRRPAFVTRLDQAFYAAELIRPGRAAARELREGKVPVWTGKREENLRKHPPSLDTYYRLLLPDLHAEINEAWRDLDACGFPA